MSLCAFQCIRLCFSAPILTGVLCTTSLTEAVAKPAYCESDFQRIHNLATGSFGTATICRHKSTGKLDRTTLRILCLAQVTTIATIFASACCSYSEYVFIIAAMFHHPYRPCLRHQKRGQARDGTEGAADSHHERKRNPHDPDTGASCKVLRSVIILTVIVSRKSC